MKETDWSERMGSSMKRNGVRRAILQYSLDIFEPPDLLLELVCIGA